MNVWRVVRRHPWKPVTPARIPKQYRARGRVFKRGNTWHMEVRMGDLVVHTDNTGHWQTILDAANQSVYAFDHVSTVGHKIKRSFSDLVREVTP